MIDAPSNRWDERYRRPGFAYGTMPNRFLASVANRIPAGRVLCLGAGEGRNAVFLAQCALDVVAVDWSGVGLAKARRRAAELGVSIKTVIADLTEYVIDPEAWDGIVSVFCHLPPAARTRLHRAAVAGLRPGGAFVLEAYTPRQLEYGTGGPPTADLMTTLEELERDLAGLDLVVARELEREVSEGHRHKGHAAVVQVLGLKPAG